MSEFRGVKAHVYQVMNVSMETTYLRYGSLSPQNFQSLMNSESKLMRETDEQQASYQEFLIQIGFSEGRCHSISILLCYPSFKHLHCKRGRYSYKPESKEKADSIILFLNSHMKNLCKAILNSLKGTLCRNSVCQTVTPRVGVEYLYLIWWGGDGTVDKTHAFGVRHLGPPRIHCDT